MDADHYYHQEEETLIGFDYAFSSDPSLAPVGLRCACHSFDHPFDRHIDRHIDRRIDHLFC